MKKDKTTEQLVKEVLSQSQESIIVSLKENLKEKILSQMGWSLDSLIADIVKEFVEKEMKADIAKELSDSKPVLLRELKKGMVKVGAKLAEAMMAHAMKNLDINSYKSKDIIKKIFD